jgi:hypothetical protein
MYADNLQDIADLDDVGLHFKTVQSEVSNLALAALDADQQSAVQAIQDSNTSLDKAWEEFKELPVAGETADREAFEKALAA